MKRYLPNGYINFDYIDSKQTPFNILICPRGTGKTYGCLEHLLLKKKEPFIFMRRTQNEIDKLASPHLNPLKPLNNDYETTYGFEKIAKDQYGIYSFNEEGKATGPLLGLALSLSTISSLRGFDGAEYKYIFFDEIVPEEHTRQIKDEFGAFFNACETINRNRELNGSAPITVYMCGNSNIKANPYFVKLELIDIVSHMELNGIPVYTNKDRGLTLFMYNDSPISEKKANSAIYRLTKGTKFSEMALYNVFLDNVAILTGSKSLQTMNPICILGEICFMKAKDNSFYYATLHKSGSPPVFKADKDDVVRFSRKYGYIINSIYKNKLIFEQESIYYMLANYLKK